MKAFFVKIGQWFKKTFSALWKWCMANKLIAGIIAGAAVVVITVAIVVPVSVSASKKKKAAQEPQQQQQQSSGEGEGGGQEQHVHQWGAPKFTWTVDHTASAEFVCETNPEHTHVENAVVTSVTEDPTCGSAGYVTYTATVNFGGKEYKDIKGEPIDPTGLHTADDYGFCTECGTYLGETFAFQDQDLFLDFSHEQMDMAENQIYFCRLSGAVSGHIFYLEDGDPWGDLQTALSGYTIISDVPSLVDLSGDYASEIGADGYLYLKLNASQLTDLNDVWFRICQEHNPDTVGYCIGEGCSYYCGEDIQVDVAKTNISLKTGQRRFFRAEATKGHYYKFQLTAITGGEINGYYLSPIDNSYVSIANIKIAGGGEFPVDAADNYIYISINPSANYTGSFTLHFEAHGGLDDYGFCAACGEYDGTDLVGMNIPDIDMEFGYKEYYRFPIKQHFAYELSDSTTEMVDGVTKGYLKLDSGMEEYVFGDTNYIEDVGDGYMYLAINCTYTSGISNGELNIHEYEEPINEYGFYNLCQEYTGFDLEYEVVFEPISLENGERLFLRFNLEDLPADKPVIEITYTSGASSSTCISYDNVAVYYFQSEAATALLPDDWYGGNWNVEYYPTSSIVTDDGYLYIVITADRAYTNSMGFCISSVAE